MATQSQKPTLAGMFHRGENQVQIPLKKVEVFSKIVDFMAKVDITQTYANTSDHSLEVEYIFPLDESAAITNFIAKINDKTLEGISKPKEEARKDYSEAISKGHTAYLLEESRPDVFLVSLGNFPSKSECSITISYIAELTAEGTKMRFMLPTTVAPRYQPPTQSDPTIPAPQIYSDTSFFGIDIRLDVEMANEVLNVSSPTHQIKVNEKKGNKANISLQQKSELDRDFFFLIESAFPTQPRVWVEHTNKFQNKESYVAGLSYFVGSEYNELKGEKEKELIFLVDVSGSMQGEKLDATKRGLLQALDFLQSKNVTLYFNIVSFSSSYEYCFRPYSQKLTSETLKNAKNYVESLRADGGTEILRPITDILNKSTEREREVIILTDGEVWNNEQIISFVNKHNETTRVFTIGVGHSVSHNLVNGIARAGRGTPEFVIPGENAQTIESKIDRQVNRALSQRIDISKVQWGNENPIKIAPSFFPTLYENCLITSLALLNSPIRDDVIISLSNNKQLHVNKNSLKFIEGEMLHQMYAKKRILDLYEEPDLQGAHTDVQKEITELGVTYNMMTKNTSFIIVDKSKVTKTDDMTREFIPQQIPRGETYLTGGQKLSMSSISLGETYLSGGGPEEILLMDDSDTSIKRSGSTKVARKAHGATDKVFRANLEDEEGEAMDILDVPGLPQQTGHPFSIDVTSLSIGIGTKPDGETISEDVTQNTRMAFIAPRSTAIPSKQTKEFKAFLEHTNELVIYFYEGERVHCKDNYKHTKHMMVLTGLPQHQLLRIEINLEFDNVGARRAFAKVYDANTHKLLMHTQPFLLDELLFTDQERNQNITDSKRLNDQDLKSFEKELVR